MRGWSRFGAACSCLLGLFVTGAAAQSVYPDALYYKFDEGSGTTTANLAVPGVGASAATVHGQTLAATGGQFGGALLGAGGDSSAYFVDSGWATNLSGDFTLGFWLDLTAVTTPNPFMYLFGDSTADLFRCFTNGASGSGGIVLKSGTWPGLVIPGGGLTAAPHHVAWVYVASSTTLHGYLDGVHVGSALQPGTAITGSGPLTIGGSATSTALLAGARVDEFRLYRTALSAAQIAATWNVSLSSATVSLAYCTAGTSTHGCLPSIHGWGTPSASAVSGFTIHVADLEGQEQGVIFYGIHGRVANAWGQGTSFFCVKSPLVRTGVQSTGGTADACDGQMSIDWLAFIAANPGALGSPFSAGDVVGAQGWYRDPPSPKTSNLGNALEFTLAP